MKKIKVLGILLISIFIFNTKVSAASGSLGVSDSSVYVGDSFTVSVNINSAAAWNVHVSASGPVSGCSINQADATSDAMDTSKSFRATCTATGTGTININLSGDVTSASDGNAVAISGNKSVTVSEKPVTPSTSSSSSSSSSTSSNSTNTSTTTKKDTSSDNELSKNNNLKSISVKGYDLVKVDNNNYTLLVSNNITNIIVDAKAEDEKAKVSGTGDYEIKVGENIIEVIITSESGSQNKINLKITRKDGYYLEDLNLVLNNEKIDETNITISADSKITEEDITKIKNSKKVVKFNYFDNKKNLIYSWEIDGNLIESVSEFDMGIVYDTENKSDIYKLSNYADGLYISFKHIKNLPKGIKLKLYVGDKFENGNVVNIYNYKNKKLNLVESKLNVKEGYIEFDVEYGSEHFITMSSIKNVVINKKEESKLNIFLIISIIELVIIIALMIILFLYFKNKKKQSFGIAKRLIIDKSNVVKNQIDETKESVSENKDIKTDKEDGEDEEDFISIYKE